MDKIYYLSHRTTVALEKSEQDLNDESLFGDMTLDSNLHREMDMMGVDGGDDDDDDDDDVVFSNDTTLNSPDAIRMMMMTMWPKLPDHRSHLGNFSCGTGTSASIVLSMSMPLRDGRCVSLKMFERMSYRG